MIVAITGKKHSGKDALAEFMQEEFNNCDTHAARMSFATPIKEAIQVIFGIPADLQGPGKEVLLPEFGISPRQLWQDLGSDWAQFGLAKRYPEFSQRTGRSLWAKLLLNRWKDYKRVENASVCIISDLRFPHEVFTLMEHCLETEEPVSVIRVVREGLTNKDSHVSETEMDNIVPIDYVVENSKGLDKLQESAVVLVKELIDFMEA